MSEKSSFSDVCTGPSEDLHGVRVNPALSCITNCLLRRPGGVQGRWTTPPSLATV